MQHEYFPDIFHSCHAFQNGKLPSVHLHHSGVGTRLATRQVIRGLSQSIQRDPHPKAKTASCWSSYFSSKEHTHAVRNPSQNIALLEQQGPDLCMCNACTQPRLPGSPLNWFSPRMRTVRAVRDPRDSGIPPEKSHTNGRTQNLDQKSELHPFPTAITLHNISSGCLSFK